jgi:hypothetical protein
MSKLERISSALIVMMSLALPAYAQNTSWLNKLADRSFEQLWVFEVEIPPLAKLIETTAWKMNCDSVIVNPSQDKIMVNRVFPHSALQYRIFFTLEQADSAVRMAARGFWFLPPDSIPRYSKSMKTADRDLLKLFLYAVTQEIAASKGAPLYNHPLPDKSFSKFTAWNLLNPGLASWYIMKDNPRTGQKSAIAWSVCFGLLDLGYIAFALASGGKMSNGQGETDTPFSNVSNQQIGIFGALTFRIAMTLGYFVDGDYRELKKSGYYFPKIDRFNFDTKYTKYIPQLDNRKNKLPPIEESHR